MLKLLELFGGIGAPRSALENLGNLCKKAKISLMKDLAISQSRFIENRTPFNGVEPNGQTSLFSDFEALTKQVAEERKGALRS